MSKCQSTWHVLTCQLKCQFHWNMSTYVSLAASSAGIFLHMSVNPPNSQRAVNCVLRFSSHYFRTKRHGGATRICTIFRCELDNSQRPIGETFYVTCLFVLHRCWVRSYCWKRLSAVLCLFTSEFGPIIIIIIIITIHRQCSDVSPPQ
jgi:hypothetical protein